MTISRSLVLQNLCHRYRYILDSNTPFLLHLWYHRRRRMSSTGKYRRSLHDQYTSNLDRSFCIHSSVLPLSNDKMRSSEPHLLHHACICLWQRSNTAYSCIAFLTFSAIFFEEVNFLTGVFMVAMTTIAATKLVRTIWGVFLYRMSGLRWRFHFDKAFCIWVFAFALSLLTQTFG